MIFPCYLAMTGAEIRSCQNLPQHPAWMACHFSSSGPGISNCPESLPDGAMLILNDFIPVDHHDPAAVAEQLAHAVALLNCESVLLDFQRPGVAAAESIICEILKAVSCPVAVSQLYADSGACPVFLPPIPPDTPPEQYCSPWNGREIWLEAALTGMEYIVTSAGSHSQPLLCPPSAGLHDKELFCHYRMTVEDDQIRFQLFRTPEDLNSLLQKADRLGVARAIGLYQELGKFG